MHLGDWGKVSEEAALELALTDHQGFRQSGEWTDGGESTRKGREWHELGRTKHNTQSTRQKRRLKRKEQDRSESCG